MPLPCFLTSRKAETTTGTSATVTAKRKNFNTPTSKFAHQKRIIASNSVCTFPLQISSVLICLEKFRSPVEPRITNTLGKVAFRLQASNIHQSTLKGGVRDR